MVRSVCPIHAIEFNGVFGGEGCPRCRQDHEAAVDRQRLHYAATLTIQQLIDKAQVLRERRGRLINRIVVDKPLPWWLRWATIWIRAARIRAAKHREPNRIIRLDAPFGSEDIPIQMTSVMFKAPYKFVENKK